MTAKHEILAVVIGAAILIGGMIIASAAAAAAGLIEAPETLDTIDLTGWLWVEVIVGSVVAVGSGFACRRIGLRRRPVLILAGIVLGLGLLEAGILVTTGEVEGVRVVAPSWLALSAPVIGALGVVLGGALGRRRP